MKTLYYLEITIVFNDFFLAILHGCLLGHAVVKIICLGVCFIRVQVFLYPLNDENMKKI